VIVYESDLKNPKFSNPEPGDDQKL